jgi:diguanylate cyclase (GGDEF)-like protein
VEAVRSAPQPRLREAASREETRPQSQSCDDLATALREAGDQGRETALLVLRINEFRELAETLGESCGLRLMGQVESRLLECLRMSDVAAQVSDDEFAIVLGYLGKLEDVNFVAGRLVKACSGVYELGEMNTHIRTSVGIALCPPGEGEAAELLRFARVALRGEGAGDLQGCHLFSRELLERQQRVVWMEAELEKALQQDRFILHYQPQYHADSRQILGLEALVRMRAESGELIPPDDFISLAENNGFIVELGRWVIFEACRQLAQWRKNGCDPVRIAVNVSPRQLLDDSLPGIVDQAIADHELDYADLELEITEECMLECSPVVERVLRALHRRGVRIAIDDFGTGYSSFVYLSRLPLNIIKMDRSFVSGIPDDPRAGQVVTAMIAMARELGFEVTVEGIETPEQCDFLLNSGCDLGQGFGLARPQGAHKIEKLLRQPRYLQAVS